jgi:hypothetical protein
VWCVCQAPHRPRKCDGECICRASRGDPLVTGSQHGCHGRCFAGELKALRAARPVLAVGDDTHTTPRATPLRSHPLAVLPVRSCGVVSPAGHFARPVLGRLRPSSAVQAAVALVALAGLALAAWHPLVAPVRIHAPAGAINDQRVFPSPSMRRHLLAFAGIAPHPLRSRQVPLALRPMDGARFQATRLRQRSCSGGRKHAAICR